MFGIKTSENKKEEVQSIEKTIYNILIKIKERLEDLRAATNLKNVEEENNSSFKEIQSYTNKVQTILSSSYISKKEWWSKNVSKQLKTSLKSKSISEKIKYIDLAIKNLEPYVSSSHNNKKNSSK